MADTKVSALTAVATPAGTDEFPVNQAGVSKKETLDQIKAYANTAPVIAAGSASAGSWPKLTPGTLLTTPEDGAIEMDATNLYGTVDADNRGYIPIKHFIRADATRTFTSNTLAQALFTTPANGALTLETGLYRVEGLLAFTGMSATSGNLLIDIKGAGTFTANDWLWAAFGTDGAAATAGALSGSQMTTAASPASVVTAGTATALWVYICGSFACTIAGTIIPSITLVTASAAVLSIGSYLMFERMGTVSVTSVGQWT